MKLGFQANSADQDFSLTPSNMALKGIKIDWSGQTCKLQVGNEIIRIETGIPFRSDIQRYFLRAFRNRSVDSRSKTFLASTKSTKVQNIFSGFPCQNITGSLIRLG